MANSPQYAAVPVSAAVQIAAGNSARDGSGQIQTLFTADAAGSGARIDTILCAATGSTTAGAVRLFIRAPGGAWLLFREVVVSAVTAAAGVAVWQATLSGLALTIAPGWSVGTSSEKSEGINVVVTSGGAL